MKFSNRLFWLLVLEIKRIHLLLPLLLGTILLSTTFSPETVLAQEGGPGARRNYESVIPETGDDSANTPWLPEAYSGVWSGTITVDPDYGSSTFTALMSLTRGKVGDIVGISSHPSINCGGLMRLQTVTETHIALVTDYIFGNCLDGSHLLRLLGNGNLQYEWHDPNSDRVDTGTLTRQSVAGTSIPSGMPGVWEGTVIYDPDYGSGAFVVQLGLMSGGLNQVFGTIQLPEGSCGGILQLESVNANEVTTSTDFTYGNCLDGSHLLRLNSNGTLTYEWHDPNSDRVDRGTLHKLSTTDTLLFDLPWDYSGSTFIQESRDTEQHGKVNSYFDHRYPTYDVAPNNGAPNVVNFQGYASDQTNPVPPFNVVYNGHDGIDYLIPDGTPVLAAASGTIDFVGPITVTCDDGIARTATVVKVNHENGYITEYWHLQTELPPGIQVGVPIDRNTAQPLGYVGNTGCSSGSHLHFEVQKQSNGQKVVVDPYGWNPHSNSAFFQQSDPWETHNEPLGIDASSSYLWQHPLEANAYFDPVSNSDITVTSPSDEAQVVVPPHAYNALLRLELAESLSAINIAGYQSALGFTFSAFTIEGTPLTILSAPFTVSTTATRRVPQDLNPTIFWFNGQTGSWQPLPTTIDPVTGNASASTRQLGEFALAYSRDNYLFLPMVGRR